MRLLYYCPYQEGGLAEYAHAQGNALVEAGVEVTMLVPRGEPGRFSTPPSYMTAPVLATLHQASRFRLIRKCRQAIELVGNGWILAKFTKQRGYKHVLFGAFYEYLAPLWTTPLRRLADKGVVFGSVIHDPERSYRIGPVWWHRWSIRRVYAVLREAFIHEPIELDTGGAMPGLRTTVIPQGIYQMPRTRHSEEKVRALLGIPPDTTVLLAFGFIRDAKNLDLVIRSLPSVPNVILVVAGREQSSSQRPTLFYQKLAETVGVGDRCRWLTRFISPEEIADIFSISDLIMLTYSAEFRSASAVLNVAARYRKPCLVSGGESNLLSVVRQHGLGICIEPDRVDAIAGGIRRFLENPPQPRWGQYEAENSWKRNAEIVRDRMAEQR